MNETNSQKKKIIVVLGMHRSGTSAITRSLKVLGAQLGDHLLPAVKGDNDKGFWEDVDLYRINERILTKLDSSWHGLSPLDSSVLVSNLLDAERKDALALLRLRLENTSVFAFKDPRTANLLPFWQSVFHELGLEDRYLLAVRDPRSVADSLSKRNGIAREKSYCLWMKHLANAVQSSAGKPRLVVDYDLLMEDPGRQLERMARVLKLTLPDSDSAECREFIDDFLSQDLRHSVYRDADNGDDSMPSFVRDLYRLLRAAAQSEQITELESTEDFVSCCARFLHYPQLFDYIDRQDGELEALRKAAESHNKTLLLTEGRLSESRQYASDLLEKHKSLYNRFTTVSETLASYKGQLSEAKHELLQSRRQNTDLLSEKLAASDSLARSQERIAELKGVVARKKLDLTRSQRKLQAVYSSTSWRVTKPVRFAKRAIGMVFRAGRNLLTDIMRRVWQLYPGGASSKARAASVLFKAFPLLFRHTATYQQWIGSRSRGKVEAQSPRAPHVMEGIERQGVQLPVSREPEVIISCWLAVDDPLIDGLTELSHQLRVLGLRTRFVGKTRFFEEKGESCLQPMPLLLSAGNYPGVTKSGPLPEWITEVYDNEFVWRDGDQSLTDEQVKTGCNRSYYFWLQQFLASRPSYVLVWGATAPLSRLHILLCKTLMIPYMVLERGHFLGTLLVDSLGQGVTSEKAIRPADLVLSKPGRIEEILRWERSVDEKVPYVASNADVDRTLLERISSANKNVIFFMGANDRGAGCARSANDPERCSFIFEDSFYAVEYLKKVVEELFPDSILLVKPHPSDRRDYNQFASNSVVIAEGLNINRLIKLSSVCVSTSTTAFAKCIIEKKPILTLAVSDVSMKNIAYECHDLSSIPVMLRSAIDQDGFENKVEAGYGFIETLFDTSLVSLTGDAPTRLKLDDICHSIYQRHLATTTPEARRVTASSLGGALDVGREVDVIIPVYGDVEVTKNCIDSVLAACDKLDYRVLIVNDASPVEGMEALVESYSNRDKVVVLRNQENVGFVGAVNRGMSYSARRDVILLNSDTVVAPGWVDRLCSHAYSSSNVATVTPFSNNASIFSVRNFPVGFDLDKTDRVEALDEALAKNNGGSAVEVPVGHGFCMFIRRSCLDRVGYFDQMTFGKGYSEEVDFCQRATTSGFKHLCATDVFVAHVGGVSFSDSADERRMKNRKIIQDKYPNYFSEVKRFIQEDPLLEYRELLAVVEESN